jgi:imidazolonepropionase-like amidohydrolase
VSGQRIPILAPDVVTALVAAGHDAGLTTIAHVATARDARVALDAGIDGLAHIFTDVGPGNAVAEEIARRAAAQGVFVIGALSFTEVITGSGAGSELVDDARIGPRLSDAAKAAIRRDLTNFPVHPAGKVNAMHAARALHKAGVPLLAGTDANDGPHGGFAVVHGASLHRELVLLTEAGMTPVEALAAATSVPARLFGLFDRDRIAPGLRADLLLVEGDPTTDITATRSIVEVWRRGVRHTAKPSPGAHQMDGR